AVEIAGRDVDRPPIEVGERQEVRPERGVRIEDMLAVEDVDEGKPGAAGAEDDVVVFVAVDVADRDGDAAAEGDREDVEAGEQVAAEVAGSIGGTVEDLQSRCAAADGGDEELWETVTVDVACSDIEAAA